MPLLITGLALVVLIILISVFKFNVFISLVIIAYGAGLALGIQSDSVIDSIEAGMGDTLGQIALILGFGAMLGRLIADAGGAHRISVSLINRFGKTQTNWAIFASSFIIGISLFWNVAFIILIPIIVSVARELKISITSLALTTGAALVVTHNFLPPHPGITIAAQDYGADLGSVLIYGILVGIPTAIVCGIWYPRLCRKWIPSAFIKFGNVDTLGHLKDWKIEETPGFGVSMLTSLLPVFLMSSLSIIDFLQKFYGFADNRVISALRFVGTPSTAILISLLFAVYIMGIARKTSMDEIMKSCGSSIAAMGMLILITGGGGAFKQVIIDGQVGSYIEQLFSGITISPVLLAWIVAVIMRVCLGSGTVAAISTAGLVIPMLGSDSNLIFVALATGCGTAFASHINDPAFWMMKEYVGMTLVETFATYTVLTTIASVMGICLVLLMDFSMDYFWIFFAVFVVLAAVMEIIYAKNYKAVSERNNL